MANSPRKMHNPDFSYSQIKFPDRDIFGPDSFGLSEINWVHPFVGPFIQFDKKSLLQQKNPFANKPIILSKVFAFFCFSRKYFFSRKINVLFKVIYLLKPDKNILVFVTQMVYQ